MAVAEERRRGGLTAAFIVLISVVVGGVLLIYLAWSIGGHRSAAQSKALAEAQVLNAEMGAIWDYINAQQDRINYNSDGRYDFKGVYCTIAAKNVAKRFMQRTDYVIRYVRENPRSGTDVPDGGSSSTPLPPGTTRGARSTTRSRRSRGSRRCATPRCCWPSATA